MIVDQNKFLTIIRKAGDAVLTLKQQGFFVNRKSNNDLVTQADLLVNDILKKHLTNLVPDAGWFSEESADDHERLQCERVWIVDPIDGTKEFVHGRSEYVISVALIDKGLPVLAAIFNPETDELFSAVKGEGAWLGDKKLSCASEDPASKNMILASRSEVERGEWVAFEKCFPIKPVGSIAYKLALVSAGYAEATFTLGPKNEWDIAAGVLLVEEAGGIVCDKYGRALRFNREDPRVSGVVAGNKHYHARIMEMIDEFLKKAC